MQNLRDKLLKAGLVTAEQAEKAEKTPEAAPRPDRRRERPERPPSAGRPSGPLMVARLQPLSSIPKLPPLEGSKASQRLDAKRQLEQGRLAVVERPDPAQIEHALVPAELALALVSEFPKAVRFLNAPGSPVGFLSDEEVKARAAAEAAETPEERAAAEAPESEEQRAEETADGAEADAERAGSA